MAEQGGVDLGIERGDEQHEEGSRREGDPEKGEDAPDPLAGQGQRDPLGGRIDVLREHVGGGRHVFLCVDLHGKAEGKAQDEDPDEHRQPEQPLQQPLEAQPCGQRGQQRAQRRRDDDGQQGRAQRRGKDDSQLPDRESREYKVDDGDGEHHAQAEEQVDEVGHEQPAPDDGPAGDGQGHHGVVIFEGKQHRTSLQEGEKECDHGRQGDRRRRHRFGQAEPAEYDGKQGDVGEHDQRDDAEGDRPADRFAAHARIVRLARAVEAEQPHQLDLGQQHPFSAHRFRAPPGTPFRGSRRRAPPRCRRSPSAFRS